MLFSNTALLGLILLMRSLLLGVSDELRLSTPPVVAGVKGLFLVRRSSSAAASDRAKALSTAGGKGREHQIKLKSATI